MDIVIGALIGLISTIVVLVIGGIAPMLARATGGGITRTFRRMVLRDPSSPPEPARLSAPLPQMGSQGMATWMQATLHATGAQAENAPSNGGARRARKQSGLAAAPPQRHIPVHTSAMKEQAQPRLTQLGMPQQGEEFGEVSAPGLCPACGHQNSPAARFCRGCRRELDVAGKV